jgi:hypothetical protein
MHVCNENWKKIEKNGINKIMATVFIDLMSEKSFLFVAA